MPSSDGKLTTTFYSALGGINQKSSVYNTGRMQFLDIRNMDFDRANALSKRPGSTQTVSAGTSGPITSVFEFIKLTGESYVLAGSDTAMFYLSNNQFTLLDAGWSNGQPADMLTFLNKAWIANGQKFSWFDGSTIWPAGLPVGGKGTEAALAGGGYTSSSGTQVATIAGLTAAGAFSFGASQTLVGVWMACSEVRADGYWGPLGLSSSVQLVNNQTPTGNVEWFGASLWGGVTGQPVSGFTASASATAIAVWLAIDQVSGPLTFAGGALSSANVTTAYGVGMKVNRVQTFGPPVTARYYFDSAVNPNADLSRFKLWTLIPKNTATLVIDLSAGWTTFLYGGPTEFSGMAFDYFSTYTPKYIEQNQNVLFASGASAAPSTVWFSDLGAPESVQPDYSFEVRTNDGDRITGTKAFKGQLLVFKQNSFHKVIGDSPENFQLVELTQEFGCLSNKSIVEYNQSIAWLDKRGIVSYNGASWELISYPVETTLRRLNLSAALENAVAVNYRDRNQLWFGVPLDSSTQNNLTIVYDYLIDAWTFFEGFNPASFAQAKSLFSRPTVWRGDYSGMIYAHGSAYFGDNGQGITCTAVPHWDKNQENETWLWRRLFLDVSPASGLTGTISGKLFSNYNTSTVQGTFAMYQDVFQTRAEMGVQAKSVTFEFGHHSASLPLQVNGFSWTKKFLRDR